jgi:lysophospholipase L1-like esterase
MAASVRNRLHHWPRALAASTLVVLGSAIWSPRPDAAVAAGPVVSHRIATCDDPAAGSDHTKLWSARYQVKTESGRIPQYRVVQVSTPPRLTSVVRAQPPRMWTLWWATGNQAVEQLRESGSELPHVGPIASSTAHLLTPDDNCSLLLQAGVTSHPTVVVGDSVSAGIQNRVLDGQLLGVGDLGKWQFAAIAGFGWSASAPTWPLSTTRGTWVIGLTRGAYEEHPSALVVELGVNDSLRATFADAERRAGLAAQIRTAVAENVAQVLHESISHVPCTVLVTAPTYPTKLFAGGARYEKEATLIDDILRIAVARTGSSRARIADWARYSAAHHLAQTSPENWFTPDGTHPNARGDAALVGLLQRTISSCQVTR